MDQGNYDFLSRLIALLLSMDSLATYDYLAHELSTSKRLISAMKCGKYISVYHYTRIVKYMLDLINLAIFMPVLLKQIRDVLINHRDLMIGTVPHQESGTCEPEKWEVLMRWDGVK